MPTNKIKQTISYIVINTTKFIELSIMKRVGTGKYEIVSKNSVVAMNHVQQSTVIRIY